MQRKAAFNSKDTIKATFGYNTLILGFGISILSASMTIGSHNHIIQAIIKASKLNAKLNPTTPRFRLYYIKSQDTAVTKWKMLSKCFACVCGKLSGATSQCKLVYVIVITWVQGICLIYYVQRLRAADLRDEGIHIM